MGDLSSWSRRSCSRLSLAVAYLAAYIKQAVAPWDSFAVLTFSRECRKIIDWRFKSDAFNPLQLMSGCGASIGALPRGGTKMFTAFSAAIDELAQRASSGSGAVDGLTQGRQHQLVLLTDGEATDDEVYEQAHALACNPSTSLNFKAFLIKIEDDTEEYLENQIGNLATFADGRPVPYIMHRTFKLPAQDFDTCTQPSKATMLSWGASTRHFSALPTSVAQSAQPSRASTWGL
ncbi:hypothetical protein N2152v2_000355 [Parachlorella kessleri]